MSDNKETICFSAEMDARDVEILSLKNRVEKLEEYIENLKSINTNDSSINFKGTMAQFECLRKFKYL